MRAITGDKALIGAAGVHFVVSELNLRGMVALPTTRNTRGIDVVVMSSDGSWHANLQVKSSKRKVKFWPVGSKYRDFGGRGNFFVFVRYLEKETRFEAFLAPAGKVIMKVDRAEDYNRRHGYKHWTPCFYLPEAPSAIEALRGRWRTFAQGR